MLYLHCTHHLLLQENLHHSWDDTIQNIGVATEAPATKAPATEAPATKAPATKATVTKAPDDKSLR